MRQIPDNQTPAEQRTLSVTTERRRVPRRDIHTVVSMIPVDDRGRPFGSRAIGICQNISADGVSLLCKHVTGQRFLKLDAVSYAFGLSSVTIKVLRETPHGEEYEIAGRFLTLPLRKMTVLRS